MSVVPASNTPNRPARFSSIIGDHPWLCHFRQWSGFILFAFVLTHLLNHAVGIFGIEAMEQGQQWRWLIWKSWIGSVALYGAFLTHMTLSCMRILQRHTWRMSPDEAWQIASGLTIPLLATTHILQTRVAGSMYGVDESYHAVLAQIWPAAAFSQTLLVLVTWIHGVIGIHHSVRYQRWYGRWRVVCLMVAVLIPTLALAGFVSSGREVDAKLGDVRTPPDQKAGLQMAKMMLDSGLGAFGIGLASLMGFAYMRRRARAMVTITYRGYGPVQVPRGVSVLEASRMSNIPHPASCRGRGRCSTCRVHILSGAKGLPEPTQQERALLAHVGARENVRLGCQLRPNHDISIRVLMPVLGGRTTDLDTEASEWALERNATVLRLDLRAFNTLTQNRLPYEIAVLVNRFAAEMTQVVESHHGQIDLMYGDGLQAIFDIDDNLKASTRAAMAAARDMGRVLDLLNAELHGALPIPIRAGFGIHTGPVILARIGEGLQDSTVHAIGSTATIAASLETASKELLADYVISAATVEASGYDFSGYPVRDIMLESQSTSVSVYAIPDRSALDKLMARPAMLRVLSTAGV